MSPSPPTGFYRLGTQQVKTRAVPGLELGGLAYHGGMREPARPLSDLRILDLSRVMAGPYASRLLCDLGADVVKLEPPEGDITRNWGETRHGLSGFYTQQNAGKRNICIDLKSADGPEWVRRLADRADRGLARAVARLTGDPASADHARHVDDDGILAAPQQRMRRLAREQQREHVRVEHAPELVRLELRRPEPGIRGPRRRVRR